MSYFADLYRVMFATYKLNDMQEKEESFHKPDITLNVVQSFPSYSLPFFNETRRIF